MAYPRRSPEERRFTHGTQNGYRQGCRCDPCCEAKSRANARRNLTPPPPPCAVGPDGIRVDYRPRIRTRGPRWRCACTPVAVVDGPTCPRCTGEAPWR